jgi:hypothetical protein
MYSNLHYSIPVPMPPYSTITLTQAAEQVLAQMRTSEIHASRGVELHDSSKQQGEIAHWNRMLQSMFQMFHLDVASVLCGCCKSRLECFICCNGCTRMLQAFVHNV